VYQVWLITSTPLGGTLPTRRLIYILLHLRTNYMLTWIRLTNCSQLWRQKPYGYLATAIIWFPQQCESSKFRASHTILPAEYIYNICIRFLHIHRGICVPSLVEIAPGVPELFPDIYTHTQTSIVTKYIFVNFTCPLRCVRIPPQTTGLEYERYTCWYLVLILRTASLLSTCLLYSKLGDYNLGVSHRRHIAFGDVQTRLHVPYVAHHCTFRW
jgi:hypothetical protein